MGGTPTKKLYIKKDQSQGVFGGIKFDLTARVELTSEEAGLVKKYKADKETLLKKEVRIPLTGKSLVIDVTIGSLVTGQIFKCNDIAEILEYEKSVKEFCEGFKNYLEVMKGFGGEETVEYN